MRVVCINDKDKPNQIKQEDWLVKGETYTVIKAVHLQIGNKPAFSLKEKPLTEENFPYEYWNAERFVPEEHYLEIQKYENVKWDAPITIE
jgi:hypothetical protein